MLLICCSHLWSMMKLLLLLLPSCPCFPPLGLLWFQSLYMLITEDRDILGRGQSNITSSSSFLSSLPSFPQSFLFKLQFRDVRAWSSGLPTTKHLQPSSQTLTELCCSIKVSLSSASVLQPAVHISATWFSIFNTQIIKSSLYLCDYESLNNRRSLT